MSVMTPETIEAFLHAQVRHWNAGDKEGFFGIYRQAAPNGLQVEYVGRSATDGWPILENMWQQQNAKFEVQELLLVVNGMEAACHNINKVRGTATEIHTIELYRFEQGKLLVRYFIQPPTSAA